MNIQIPGIQAALTEETDRRHPERTEGILKDFGKFLEEADTMQSMNLMQQEISEKFHVKLYVADYACGTTDDTARSHDLAMVDMGQFQGNGNVVVSRNTLLKMVQDARFRDKVYASIEDLNKTGIRSGGIIKSTGAVIHEDGTAGYWTELDPGDEGEGGTGRNRILDGSVNDPAQKRENKTARMLEHDFIKYPVFMGSMAGCSDSDRTEWAYNRKKQMMQ